MSTNIRENVAKHFGEYPGTFQGMSSTFGEYLEIFWGMSANILGIVANHLANEN